MPSKLVLVIDDEELWKKVRHYKDEANYKNLNQFIVYLLKEYVKSREEGN